MNKKETEDQKVGVVIWTALIILLGLVLWSIKAPAQDLTWQHPQSGVDFTVLDDHIWVFKIHPDAKWQAVYASQTANFNQWHTLPDWVEAKAAAGGINLGMFHDKESPSGYTKINNKVLQRRFAEYNAFIAWNSDTIRVMDRTEHHLQDILNYPNVSQNIRMITKGENKWKETTKKWSASTLGIDSEGYIYLFHTREAYNMKTFGDIILENLDIQYMVYLEGGSEASVVFVGHFTKPFVRFSRMGSYETGVFESNDNIQYWKLPFALIFNL